MAKSTTVTKKKSEAVALPEELQALVQEDAGQGLETMTQQDLMIPFINLLQPLSPQINKRNEKHIEGAEAGMFFNTVTEQLYDGEEGATMIPVHYQKVYNEWRPRDGGAGGGLVATHATEREARENMEPGNEVLDTANHFVLIQGADGEWSWAVLSMTSTKLKVSRRWNSQLSLLKVPIGDQKITPPTFATRWRLRTVEQTNDKGTFFNYKIEYVNLVDDAELYAQAKAFREMVQSGAAKVNFEKGRELEEEDEDDPDF